MANGNIYPKPNRAVEKTHIGPVFIVGCSRSGTTLLHSILAQHSDLAAFPETNVLHKTLNDFKYRRFGRLVVPPSEVPRALLGRLINTFGATTVFDWDKEEKVRERLRNLGGGVPDELLPMGKRHSIRRIFSEFCGIMDYAACGKRWIEKSPQNVFCIHLMDRYIPTGRFIHIAREGTSNVASLIDASSKYHMFKSRFGGAQGVDKAIHFYNSALKMSSRFAHRRRHIVIRYEDLAEDPRTTMASVGSFLGIEIQDETLCYRTDGITMPNEVWKQNDSEIRPRKSKFSEIFDLDKQEYIDSKVAKVDALFPRRLPPSVPL